MVPALAASTTSMTASGRGAFASLAGGALSLEVGGSATRASFSALTSPAPTPQAHPATGVPTLMLHPCDTAAWLQDARSPEHPAPGSTLLSWFLRTLAQCGEFVRPELYKLLRRELAAGAQ